MKKMILFIVAAFIMLPAASYAQSDAKYAKALNKEYKEKKKELEKGGWQLYGTARSWDVALMKHYKKLEELGSDGQQIIGSAPRFSSKNVGHQMAFNSAANQYAQMTSSTMKGIIESTAMSDGANTENEVDNFMASFTRAAEATIKGELVESFSLIREIEPGVYEMESYYIYNKNSASEAQLRALRNAANESETAKKLAEKIEKALEK